MILDLKDICDRWQNIMRVYMNNTRYPIYEIYIIKSINLNLSGPHLQSKV